MYIQRNTSKHKSGKIYNSVVLRESYREGKVVKKRTLANLSHLSEDLIDLIDQALKNKNKPIQLSFDNFKILQGRSIGSIYVLHTIAQQLGIVAALGSSFNAKLALWLIYSRILEQGSRLSATRLDSQYDLASVIGLERGFDENDFYTALRWLTEQQNTVENSLFNISKKSDDFYWYDVTSSYLEGIQNELSAFGYNRDQKKKKKIIVIGLLCRENGDPVSIEAFKGNTQDTLTFESQLIKLKHRFDCKSVTLVCDRGLIKDKQKKLLKEYGFHYITALPMPQVKALLNSGKINLKDFNSDLKSITIDKIRYIYRCNPELALEANKNRQDRLQYAQDKTNQINVYLKEHPKACVASAKKKIDSFLTKYGITDWVEAGEQDRQFTLQINIEMLKLKSELDGCYIWTTDRSEEELTTKDIYDRYKDLKYVEDNFRSFKTNFLEMRPIHVRTESSTRGHLLVTMLAHLILRRLREAWCKLNKSVNEALTELSLICQNTMQFEDGRNVHFIPLPNEGMKTLLDALNITLPKNIEEKKVPVVTRKKIRKI